MPSSLFSSKQRPNKSGYSYTIERFRRDFNALLKREGKLLLNAYLSCCTDDLV